MSIGNDANINSPTSGISLPAIYLLIKNLIIFSILYYVIIIPPKNPSVGFSDIGCTLFSLSIISGLWKEIVETKLQFNI